VDTFSSFPDAKEHALHLPSSARRPAIIASRRIVPAVPDFHARHTELSVILENFISLTSTASAVALRTESHCCRMASRLQPRRPLAVHASDHRLHYFRPTTVPSPDPSVCEHLHFYFPLPTFSARSSRNCVSGTTYNLGRPLPPVCLATQGTSRPASQHGLPLSASCEADDCPSCSRPVGI
jgi:hypothetical protein